MINIKKIVIGGIGVLLLLAIGYGTHALIQHVNGTSPAQIEARRRIRKRLNNRKKQCMRTHNGIETNWSNQSI